MSVQIETSSGKTKLPTRQERLENAKAKIKKHDVQVLAALKPQAKRAAMVGEKLGIEEIVVCESVDELLNATTKLSGNRVVAGVLEIEAPGRTIPTYGRGGEQVHAVDLVTRLDARERLGRVDIEVAAGTSCMALVMRGPKDPVLNEIVRNGADQTAIRIAQPYGAAA